MRGDWWWSLCYARMLSFHHASVHAASSSLIDVILSCVQQCAHGVLVTTSIMDVKCRRSALDGNSDRRYGARFDTCGVNVTEPSSFEFLILRAPGAIKCHGRRSKKRNESVATPHRRNVCLRRYRLTGLVMTLTFDL